jgi:zinc/manganese transport system substrate-binding protein
MNHVMRTILAALALVAALPAQAALGVFACEAEWGALARELGGKDVAVYVATTALQDVHKIQARPSLIARYRQADLLVCTGAELELGWLPALAEKGNNPRIAPGAAGYFEASRHVRMLEVPASVDRAMGDVHPYGNPHIQTDPRNIALVATALAAKLAELDAANAAAYRERLQSFEQRWSASLQKWSARAQPLKGMAVLSGHKSWAYLYDWLGMKELDTLEPRPGIPPSAAHLERLLALLQKQPARMVVYAAYQDSRPSEWIAQRAGIPAVALPFSPGGADGTDDLFGLFDVTLDRLLQAAQARP